MACDEATTEILERQLAAVRVAAAGESEGLFGPASMTWRIDREAATFLGAGRALLMQLAHPWVAAAIAEHSDAGADPVGRFHRTFAAVYTMVFGSLDQALAAARRLHMRHATVTGTMPAAVGPFAQGSAYRANDIAALRFVFATLIESAVLAHDLVLPTLSGSDRERYYAESKLFAALFGLAADDLPADWSAFTAYNAAMVCAETLTVGPAARDIAQLLLAGGAGMPAAPRWYRAITAAMLPQRLRAPFGLPFEDRERRSAERALKHFRRFYPRLPAPLRYVGPYHEAAARLAGKRAGTVARLMNRLWIGRPLMEPDAQ